MSIDALLYASISRHIATTGEWFRLYGNIPHFNPFYEHPHLGFWVTALFFKILPAADWVARMPGHLFYVLSLFVLFGLVRRISSESAAIWTVLSLWIWPTFSNYFSTFYLDSGLLFCGLLGLFAAYQASEKRSFVWAALAGACLALAFLYKGMAAFGFVPTLALALLWGGTERREGRSASLQIGISAVLGCTAVLGIYLWALKTSSVPDFLNQYFDRQWHARFQSSYAVSSGLPWIKIARGLLRVGTDTFWLALLMPLGLFLTLPQPGAWRRWDFWMPLSLLVSFLAMYIPADRLGGQYWLTVLPWCAWMIGIALARLASGLNLQSVVRVTQGFALAAVIVIQYIPFRTHHFEPPQGALDLRNAVSEPRLLYRDTAHESDFVLASIYAWYGDLTVQWADPSQTPPVALKNAAYFFEAPPSRDRKAALLASGWCSWRNYGQHELWRGCAWADQK